MPPILVRIQCIAVTGAGKRQEGRFSACTLVQQGCAQSAVLNREVGIENQKRAILWTNFNFIVLNFNSNAWELVSREFRGPRRARGGRRSWPPRYGSGLRAWRGWSRRGT